jgi:xylulokinase
MEGIMDKKIIAYDLGTGGSKASLYNKKGECLDSVFVAYDTYYPRSGYHEQRPADWWDAIVKSTRLLLKEREDERENIHCLALSGHSLGVVPLDKSGNLLREYTPIWSDARANIQAQRFFERVSYDEWYMKTGNGFGRALYSIFKIMWYKDNEPDMFKKVDKILGTKDYINYQLTGKIATDYSYASGLGAYDLKNWCYCDEYLEKCEIDKNILPLIVPSTEIIGQLTKDAALALGLSTNVSVACGGVDNSCMAVGARNIKNGRVYTSLGSSAWIAVTSDKPVLDLDNMPFVFANVIPDTYNSAVGIYSAGNSLKWVRDNICGDIAKEFNDSAYDQMTKLAMTSPIGSNKLLFVPSLAGGHAIDPHGNMRGAYVGLDLGHKQKDLIRSAMEGITLNLRIGLDVLKNVCDIGDEMIFVGGGSKSDFWMQMFADILETNILKTNIDQDAGSLGAAAIAAVGSGMWSSFDKIDDVHKQKSINYPNADNKEAYEYLMGAFKKAWHQQAQMVDTLSGIEQ